MIDQALAVESGIPEPNAICLAWIIQVKIHWINCGGIQLPIVSWWGLNKGARYPMRHQSAISHHGGRVKSRLYGGVFMHPD